VTTKQQITQALTSPDEEIRLQGLRGLSLETAEELLDLVFLSFGDASWRVRKEAIDLFLRMPLCRDLVGEIIELLHAEENAGLRNAAVEILVRMGRDAVPMLIDQIRSPDHDVRKFIVDILGDIEDQVAIPAILNMLQDDDSNVRAAAAENLGKLKSEEAVPALLEAMQTDDILFRFTILDSLSKIGSPIPLVKVLPYKDEKLLRKALIDCLGMVGDATAAPELVAGLTDAMRNVRESAVLAVVSLSERYPDAVQKTLVEQALPETIPFLLDILSDDKSEALRRAAITLLGRLGAVDAVMPLLVQLETEALQQFALTALVDIGSVYPESLLHAWEEVSGLQRAYLAHIIGESVCTMGLALLQQAAREDENVQVKQLAAHALGKLGKPEALLDLVNCLRGLDPVVQEAATQALTHLGAQFPEATLSALEPLLQDQVTSCRMSAVSVIGRIDDPAAIIALGMALKDPAPEVRRAAVKSFEGRSLNEHLTSIMMALTDEDAEVRRTAVDILGGCGDGQAIDGLRLALQDEDIWVRSAAVRAYGRLGGVSVFAEIHQITKDPVGLVSIAALETLLDLDLATACPCLIEALDHQDEEVVSASLNMLSKCGGGEWLKTHADRLINHSFWAVRIHFVRYLVESRGVGARPLLEERLQVETEDLVRQQIQDLLEDISPR
jgi:HEAT repeat protein